MKGLSRSIAFVIFASISTSVFALDKSISESYAKVQAAVLKKDSKAMMQLWLAYVDPSCVSTRKGKVVTYKQMTDMVKPQLKMVKKVNSCKIQVVASKTRAGKTICSVLTAQSFVINVGGKDSTFDQVTTVEDTWKKIGGKFKIVEIKTIKETLKQDGAIVPNS